MFTIEKMIFSKIKAEMRNDCYVHPFYKTAFCRLYEMEESEVKAEDGVYPHDNYEFLIPIIRKLADGQDKDDITHFYDVRTTEEFSQPAPEYALLKGAFLPKVAPLGVKGMGAFAFPFALTLAENSMEDNKLALVICAEIYVPADGEVYQNSMKSCCGFLLRKDSLEQVKGRANILAYRYNVTWEEVCQYRQDNCMEPAHVMVYEGSSLMDALEMLDKEQEKGIADFLAVWKQDEKYGFIHVGRR